MKKNEYLKIYEYYIILKWIIQRLKFIKYIQI
jgi:hypothetical protein